MSVILARTLPYGPAKIDIQIEQAADFVLPIQITVAGTPIPGLVATDVKAYMSPQWSPGQEQIELTVEADPAVTAGFLIRFPAADSAALSLPFPPRKTREPQKFELGGWVLHVTSGGITFRYAEGQVFMDRAPWLT